MPSEVDYGSKKWMKHRNNVRNVFRDIKSPLGNDMEHLNGIFWSLWKKIQKMRSGPGFGGG